MKLYILSYLSGVLLFLGGSNSEVIRDNGFNNRLLTRNHTKRRINDGAIGKKSSRTIELSKELLAEGKGE